MEVYDFVRSDEDDEVPDGYIIANLCQKHGSRVLVSIPGEELIAAEVSKLLSRMKVKYRTFDAVNDELIDIAKSYFLEMAVVRNEMKSLATSILKVFFPRSFHHLVPERRSPDLPVYFHDVLAAAQCKFVNDLLLSLHFMEWLVNQLVNDFSPFQIS